MRHSETIARRCLSVAEAAQYCGMGRDKFKVLCPIPRIRVHEGPKGLRYDKNRLDKWIETLPVEGEDGPAKINWLDRAGDAKNQYQRRKTLQQ